MLKGAASSLVLSLHVVDGAPEWIHLIPAGEFRGADGRGPFVLPDPHAFAARFAAEGQRFAIDENHAIDRLTAKGGSTPARGWVVELQAREDGIWGRVEWTETGRRLVAEREYGFISPAILHTREKPHRITGIFRAALTNDPNLKNLQSLHTSEENGMDKELREALGLPEDAADQDVLAAVKTAHELSTSHPALMARIAEAAGADKALTGDALIEVVKAHAERGDKNESELEKALHAVQKELGEVKATHAKERAVAVIDEAIKAGKVFPALRDHYIARHTRAPEEVETEIKALPSIHSGGLGGKKPPETRGEDGLSESDRQVCQLMGLDPKQYAETLAAEAKQKETL
jgi:phage I-like protein